MNICFIEVEYLCLALECVFLYPSVLISKSVLQSGRSTQYQLTRHIEHGESMPHCACGLPMTWIIWFQSGHFTLDPSNDTTGGQCPVVTGHPGVSSAVTMDTLTCHWGQSSPFWLEAQTLTMHTKCTPNTQVLMRGSKSLLFTSTKNMVALANEGYKISALRPVPGKLCWVMIQNSKGIQLFNIPNQSKTPFYWQIFMSEVFSIVGMIEVFPSPHPSPPPPHPIIFIAVPASPIHLANSAVKIFTLENPNEQTSDTRRIVCTL